jgi:hypothetical protein
MEKVPCTSHHGIWWHEMVLVPDLCSSPLVLSLSKHGCSPGLSLRCLGKMYSVPVIIGSVG